MTREGQPGTLRSIAIGACIFCVVFIRATGILLLGSFLLAGLYRLLVHRRERETVKKIVLELLVVVLSFAVPFLLASLVFPGGGGSYLSQYASMSVENIREFAVRYFEVYAVFFGAPTGWRYLYYVLVVFFLIGAWKHWRQDLVLLIFFALWMAVHIPYPYWQGPRYIFPLLPIFFYFTFQGMIFALRRLPERNARAGQRIFYGFWSIIIAAFLVSSTSTAVFNLQNDRIMNGPFDPYSREVYQYIQEQTPAGSVVVFFKPRVMKLMTGRDSIMSMDCEHVLNGDILVLSRKVGPNQQIPPEQIDACSLPLNEVAFYRDRGIPIEFVGHPLAEEIGTPPPRGEVRRALGLPDGVPYVASPPGQPPKRGRAPAPPASRRGSPDPCGGAPRPFPAVAGPGSPGGHPARREARRREAAAPRAPPEDAGGRASRRPRGRCDGNRHPRNRAPRDPLRGGLPGPSAHALDRAAPREARAVRDAQPDPGAHRLPRARAGQLHGGADRGRGALGPPVRRPARPD